MIRIDPLFGQKRLTMQKGFIFVRPSNFLTGANSAVMRQFQMVIMRKILRQSTNHGLYLSNDNRILLY